MSRSVDLISRRISSRDLEMKADSPISWSRIPLIRSSSVRWNRFSIIDIELIDCVTEIEKRLLK